MCHSLNNLLAEKKQEGRRQSKVSTMRGIGNKELNIRNKILGISQRQTMRFFVFDFFLISNI